MPGSRPARRIVAFERDGHTFVPDGATVFVPGDVVTVTLGAGTRTAVFELLAGAEQG